MWQVQKLLCHDKIDGILQFIVIRIHHFSSKAKGWLQLLIMFTILAVHNCENTDCLLVMINFLENGGFSEWFQLIIIMVFGCSG